MGVNLISNHSCRIEHLDKVVNTCLIIVDIELLIQFGESLMIEEDEMVGVIQFLFYLFQFIFGHDLDLNSL
jgi:hypothetical protein